METKNMMLWGVIGVLLILAIFLTVKASSLGDSQASGKLDTTGWTENEKMNYDMHGTIPARVQGNAVAQLSSAPSGSGMVGGC